MALKIIIGCLLLIFTAAIGFGQKVKPRPASTPPKGQKKLTEKQKLDLIKRINELLEQSGEHIAEATVESRILAIGRLQAALKLVASVHGQLGEQGKAYHGTILFSLGLTQSLQGEKANAITTLEKSLSLLEKLPVEDADMIPLIHKFLGENYAAQNQPRQAIKHFEAFLDLGREILKKETNPERLKIFKGYLASVLTNLTNAYLLSGLKPLALGSVRESAQIYTELGNEIEVLGAIFLEGRVLFESGEFQPAAEVYQQAIEKANSETIRQKYPVESVQIIAGSYSTLGYIWGARGDKNIALDYLQKARSLCERNDCGEIKTVISNNLGLFYMSGGDYAEAINYFSKSLQTAQESKNQYLEAKALQNMGVSYFELGNAEKAAFTLAQSTQLYTKLNDLEGTADSLLNLGEVFTSIGRTDKSLEYLQTALKYFVMTGNKLRQAATSNLIARAFHKQNETGKAVEMYQKTLLLSKELGNKVVEGAVLFQLGELHLRKNEVNQALPLLLNSLQIYQERGHPVGEAVILGALSRVAKEQKNLPLAILYGKRSINSFQSVRGNLKALDKETQDIFENKISGYYQFLADLLISQGRIAEAEQVLALLKEEELYEYVRRDDKVANELKGKLSLTEEETAAFKRYNEFSEQIALIGKEYSQLEAERRQLPPDQPFGKQARFDELGKKLKDATEVFLKFLDELKVEFGEDNARVAQVDSGLQALLKEMNAKETVIISTIAGPNRLNLILTADSFQKAYTVDINAEDLNKLVAEFRKAVQNPGIDPRPAGQKLYEVLVKPLEKELAATQAKTIVWSLDGTLRYAPISALWDGKKYLAENFANAVITLASRDKLKDAPGDKENWRALGFGVSKAAKIEESETAGSREFDPLPSVPEELCRVIKDGTEPNCSAPGIINGRRFLDEKFTLQEFKDQLGKYSLVHIASHFSLKAGNDRNSYLLLGGGNERRLTIAELNRSNAMFVGVELLTLSACNTAMTGEKKANGVEIEGFGAIAQKQGAKSVLATLWSVADPSTRDLMNEFYTFLKLRKLSKAEALREAQVKLLYGQYSAAEIDKMRSDLAGQTSNDANQKPFPKDQKRPFAHPFYWSPFVLIGNWQ